MVKNEVSVYAEGGGDKRPVLESELRRGFSDFFDKAGLHNRKPKVIACGSRENAFKDFCLAIAQGQNALLMVDSEKPISPAHEPPTGNQFLPWDHLKSSDNWDKPHQATDTDCHLMVQCMESWFIADWETVARFFGKDYKDTAKPSQTSENISKDEVFKALAKATRDCKSGAYGKGPHSFKLLALIKPDRVSEASPWAKRFIDEILKRKSIN